MLSLRKARLLVCVMAAMLVIAMIGGTWAYSWTQEIQTRNEFQLGKYSTMIEEAFVSPSDWQPGVEVNKDVVVANKGEVPVFVKVIVHQEWIRTENIYDLQGNVIFPAKGEPFSLTFDNVSASAQTFNAAPVNSAALGAGDREYAALIGWGSNVTVLSTGSVNGSLSLGLPKVSSPQQAKSKWLLMSETPDSSGNLTFYYVGVLDGAASSPKLIDHVTMNPNIGATMLQKDTVWDEKSGQWVTTTRENQTGSYENAQYNLSVSMYTVQATVDALPESFQADTISEQEVVAYLQTLGIQPSTADKSHDDSVTVKKLYLNQTDGKLTYTPVRGSDEGWFMSHLNMLPGGAYTDTLKIQNQTKQSYDLYMQVIPVDQSVRADKLLEYISMKVYNGDALIYDGKATGMDYIGSKSNLQNVIALGSFAAGAQTQIKVELELDKNTPLEYADILSIIDWKFMTDTASAIEPTPSPTPTPRPTATPKPSSSSSSTSGPKTGDFMDVSTYTTLMLIGTAMLVLCLVFLICTRKRAKDEEEQELRMRMP